MNLINIQTTTVSVQLCYINTITRHSWPRECASLDRPNSCRLGVNEILRYESHFDLIWMFMNLINIQTITVSVQIRYINPITRHPVRKGNVLPWIAQTVVVRVLMRFCAMNLIDIQTITV